jgi:hypothetical protein
MSSRAASKHDPGCSAGQMVIYQVVEGDAEPEGDRGRRWRCRTGRGEGSARTRDRRRGSALTDAVSGPASAGARPSAAPDLSRPGCSRTAYGVQRRGDQLAEDPRAGRGTAGGDPGRDRARTQRPGKEAPGGRKVTPPGQQDVDDLAMLVDAPCRQAHLPATFTYVSSTYQRSPGAWWHGLAASMNSRLKRWTHRVEGLAEE